MNYIGRRKNLQFTPVGHCTVFAICDKVKSKQGEAGNEKTEWQAFCQRAHVAGYGLSGRLHEQY
jgi:hypothetical protein